MSQLLHLATLVARQDSPDEATTTVPLAGTPGHCEIGSEYDGNIGVRISAIFVILVGSMFGMSCTFLCYLMSRLMFDRRVVPSFHSPEIERQVVRGGFLRGQVLRLRSDHRDGLHSCNSSMILRVDQDIELTPLHSFSRLPTKHSETHV